MGGLNGPPFLLPKRTHMRLTPLEERITKLIEPTVAGLGYTLVCVQETGEGIQIMAEDPATGLLGMDDCTKLNRAIGAILDVEDPIERAYRLEVSSPGIDRLLMKEKDYTDHLGLEAKIELDFPLNGQKKFRGRIQDWKENTVILVTEDQGEVHLPFPDIRKAKLVMNDELIKVTQKRFKDRKQTLEDSTTNEEVEDHGTAASI